MTNAMHHQDTLYIDGQWRKPSGRGSIEVHSASTEEVIGIIPEGDHADAGAAVAAARRAFGDWSQTTPQYRSELLQKIHDGLKARTTEIAHIITGEVGMPIKLSARIQAGMPIAHFGAYAAIARDFEFEGRIGNSVVLREPIGVVACITPWNYPLNQIAAKVAPALAAGCTVVLKPSEIAPLNAFILAEVIHEAGIPAGVFNLVTGFGEVVGEALVADPEVDMVSFTGSTRAGKRISEVAAGTVKRVALELGGKSAAIILDDADLAVAVKGIVNACYLNAGQTCTAHTRLLVSESRYAQAARLAVEAASAFTLGDPYADSTRMGPLASKVQRDRVRACIAAGIAEGAELLCGGAQAPAGLDRGYYVQPTVFGRVDPKGTLAQNEIFGPVLSIITYRDGDEDDAVRIANDSIYGLSGGVWSGSDEHALKVARRIRTGQVDINGAPYNMLAPFGGYKQSGIGREMGRFGLEEFLEYKSVQLPVPKNPEKVT